MALRLIEHSADRDGVAAQDVTQTDPWIIEVLLDTLAVALHVPLRLIIVPRFEAVYAPGTELNATVCATFGDVSGFETQLHHLASDADTGMKQVNAAPWNGFCAAIKGAILTSNSDPFWTVMRGLNDFDRWEQLWLLANCLAGDGIAPLPPPFGEYFAVCRATVRPFGLQLVAGPVWHWDSGRCGEPGVVSNGMDVVRRISLQFAGHISDHKLRKTKGKETASLPDKGVAENAEREPGGSFTADRLARSIAARPPMLPADLRRRVRLAAAALEHALSVEVERPPRVNELVGIAMAALTIAERCDSGAQGLGAGIELWHRLEGGTNDAADNQSWLVSTLKAEGPVASRIDAGPPPAGRADLKVVAMAADTDDPDEMAFGHLMVDYAIGRSAYIRERMTVLRLWLRDNFARWLTTPNVQNEKTYKRSVDHLAARVAQIFVADICSIFRYDAEAKTLDRLGRFSIDKESSKPTRKASYDSIRADGTDLAQRRTSPSYRAIDGATAVHEREFYGKSELDVKAPCTVLVVPILVLGRPWGAIELIGFRPHQFVSSATAWLDEVGTLVGSDLYFEGILNNLHEMSRAVLSKDRKHAQLRDVLGQLAKVFVASSGAIYLQYPRRTAEFECVAFFGRPGYLPNGKLSGFNIEDSVSKAALILRDGMENWLAGEIGKPPFDGEWAARGKAKALLVDGHKYIAMMPLHDASDRLIGCITLTGREEGPFEERFQYLAEFATRYAGVAIDAIKRKHEPDESARELMAHSLKTRVDRVAGAADTIGQLLHALFGDASDIKRIGLLLKDVEREAARHLWSIDGQDRVGRDLLSDLQRAFDAKSQTGFITILRDLSEHTKVLRTTAAYLAGDESNTENPYETKERRWSGTPTALRDCLLGCVKAVVRMRGAKMTMPPLEELGHEVRVRVSPVIISDIINNFCDNAIKYSLIGTSASIRYRRLNATTPASLEFRNLAPPLSDEDLDKLGTAGFRSDYAKSRSQDGQGRGLLSSRRLAERWDMKLIYRQEPNDRGSDVWHAVGLYIPADLLFDDAIETVKNVIERP